MKHGPSRTQAKSLRVLVFTTVWPTARLPLNGLFVRRRIEATSENAEALVVAPVPLRRAFEPGGRRAIEPHSRTYHPVFWYIPGFGKCLDGLWLFFSSIRAVARLKRRIGFDVIDAHFGYPDGFAAALLGLVLRTPFVVTFRGSELVVARFKMRRAALQFVARRAHRVVAVSTQLAQLAHKLGADPRRTLVIGNGVDLDLFVPMDRGAARERLGRPRDGALILCVGHLARVKRFDLVLEALKIVKDRRLNVRLAIVGGEGATDLAYSDRLKERVRSLQLDEHVLFAGAVDPGHVALWMNAADVFVLTSEREGSPNVVLEALATGTPVVTTDVGDLRQMIDRSNGILIPSNPTRDEIAAAVATAIARNWNRCEIRQTVARRSWSAVGEHVVSMWRAAIDSRRKFDRLTEQC